MRRAHNDMRGRKSIARCGIIHRGRGHRDDFGFGGAKQKNHFSGPRPTVHGTIIQYNYIVYNRWYRTRTSKVRNIVKLLNCLKNRVLVAGWVK